MQQAVRVSCIVYICKEEAGRIVGICGAKKTRGGWSGLGEHDGSCARMIVDWPRLPGQAVRCACAVSPRPRLVRTARIASHRQTRRELHASPDLQASHLMITAPRGPTRPCPLHLFVGLFHRRLQ